MLTALLVAIGGGAGAALRFLVDSQLQRFFGKYPGVATALINVAGSFTLGFVAVLGTVSGNPTATFALLGVGLCGGFTTFSTAMVDGVRLAQQRRYIESATLTVGTAVVCVVGVVLGAALADVLV